MKQLLKANSFSNIKNLFLNDIFYTKLGKLIL